MTPFDNPALPWSTRARQDPGHFRASSISVAPMMEWTTSPQRRFMRCITRHALLYTEMVTSAALIHGDTQHLLAHHESESPLALQLGGSNPTDMAHCAQLAERQGFNEVNINVGCPSDRVQNGAFGACMMTDPRRIADCVDAMKARVAIPVTVKTRIGVDHQDHYEFLHEFARQINAARADRLIVHARKAWLAGLSPKQNREVPPLDYARIHRLAADFPDLPLSINGGVTHLNQAAEQLAFVDGVMMGREAYRNPYIMSAIDQRFFSDPTPVPKRSDIVEAMLPCLAQHLSTGGQLKDFTRHMLGLFHGQPGGKAWRRVLSEQGNRSDAGLDVVHRALACVQPRVESA